jgi:predicted  nucleic acid-binding Zn-ribbon protein
VSTRDVELLEAEARYCRERISLLRAKLYGRGLGSTARLQELERELERAEQRLRQARREPQR